MIAHHLFLVFQNQLAYETVFYFLILLSGISAVYRDFTQIGLASIVIAVMSGLIGYTLERPEMDPNVFLGVTISMMVIFLVINTSRGDLSKHLEFSTEVVNQADALVFIVNQKGENVFTGQTIRTILGFAPAEISGHDWIEKLGVNSQDANRVKNNLIRIAKGIIDPEYNEYQALKSKEGEIKWISFREKRIDNDRVLVIGIDVTEHKAIQDELATSERNFRQINETLSDVFYLYNVLNQTYEYVSPNTERVLGVFPDYFYKNGNYTVEYVIDEDREEVRRTLKKVNNGIPIDIEYRVRIGDKIKWIREKSYPVRDEEGVVIKKSGLCQDITARKLAEEEIEKLSLIASHTDNFILMINKDNRIEWANPSFTRLTGYAEEDILDKLPGEILIGPLTLESKIEQITTAVFDHKQQMQCEMIAYKKDEQPFNCTLEVTPLMNEYGRWRNILLLVQTSPNRKKIKR